MLTGVDPDHWLARVDAFLLTVLASCSLQTSGLQAVWQKSCRSKASTGTVTLLNTHRGYQQYPALLLCSPQAAQSSKDSRNAILQAKRIRKGAFAHHLPAHGAAAVTGQASVASLVETANKAAGNPGVRLGAIRGLRRLLSTGKVCMHVAAADSHAAYSNTTCNRQLAVQQDSLPHPCSGMHRSAQQMCILSSPVMHLPCVPWPDTNTMNVYGPNRHLPWEIS